MKHFAGGFLAASLVWAGVMWAQASGHIDLFGNSEEMSEEVVEDAGTVEEEPTEAKVKKKRKRRGKRRKLDNGSRDRAEGTEEIVGDDMSAADREVSMGAGGEQQLSSAQIDRGVDSVFRGIERCLVLVPPDESAAGKVIVGMKIAPGGSVSAVNLRGPNSIVKGESGACLRRTIRGIKYSSFDGPEMTTQYPIVFE